MRGILKALSIVASLGLGLSLSGCASSEPNNKAACEEFQYLVNSAYLLGEDLIFDGARYSEDLKYRVIPLADQELSVVLVNILSVMEQTNSGSALETLEELELSIQTLYDSCKEVGVDLSN